MKNNIILFDDDNWEALLPLTYTKPICELRLGILTIREKWQKYLNAQASYITQDFLSEKYPIEIQEDNIIINATYLPNTELVERIKSLEPNEALLDEDELIAARLKGNQFDHLIEERGITELDGTDIHDTDIVLSRIGRPYDLFILNDQEIKNDFNLLTQGRTSLQLSKTNTHIGSHPIFIEEGASIEASILNTNDGPIYIGEGATVMEGSMIRGSFALCKGAQVKMGAKIYGATTVGPYSKVGGEINNCILSGYSNKGHDGFLGNSVIGEWCNIGADSNNSNLKNNYAAVRLWSYETERFENTDLQFCGLIMGDHSKTGINTMINTGTVIGVNANIYGSGFPRNFIPSYSWGGASGFKTYLVNKSFETAETMMARRGLTLSDQDKRILEHVYYYTSKWRVWEKEAK